MTCPRCHAPDSRVVDSRDSHYGIRRRRRCDGCGFRWTTYERSDAPLLAEEELRKLRDALTTVLALMDQRKSRPWSAEPKRVPPLPATDNREKIDAA